MGFGRLATGSAHIVICGPAAIRETRQYPRSGTCSMANWHRQRSRELCVHPSTRTGFPSKCFWTACSARVRGGELPCPPHPTSVSATRHPIQLIRICAASLRNARRRSSAPVHAHREVRSADVAGYVRGMEAVLVIVIVVAVLAWIIKGPNLPGGGTGGGGDAGGFADLGGGGHSGHGGGMAA
jgi:hypothetical protein